MRIFGINSTPTPIADEKNTNQDKNTARKYPMTHVAAKQADYPDSAIIKLARTELHSQYDAVSLQQTATRKL